MQSAQIERHSRVRRLRGTVVEAAAGEILDWTLAELVREAPAPHVSSDPGPCADLENVPHGSADQIGEKRADRFERRLIAKTEHLLGDDGHWAAVELIAADLVRLGTISGRAARHLFDRCCKSA